ncbi:MAG: FkbM family methyltransferase [Alphaproteobacteria bacterium]|nr:FkbM family methyltransferase [Alphaproteobacteria bacterium]
MTDWIPPYTLEERLKYALVPASLYIRYRTAKEWRWGEREIRLLPFLADPTRNSLDIGAHKGVYSWALRTLCRRVYAFEPNPKIFPILNRISKGNIEASPIALSNESGTAVFRVPRHRRGGFSNQGGSLSAVKVSGEFVGVEVETRRLDDLDLRDIGFMKIDVEGFELEVLSGAAECIARDRPVMLIEIEEAHTKIPIEDALDRVLALGYRGLFLRRGVLTPLTEFDGAQHHREPQSREDYVFNFIFLPTEHPRLA